MEAQALKILGDILPVETKAIQESITLGWEPLLDVVSCDLGELMSLKFLPDIWRELKDLEEKYHVLRWPPLELGRRYVVDLYGEHLEAWIAEVHMEEERRMQAQSKWCRSEGKAEGERLFFRQLLEMGRRDQRVKLRFSEALSWCLRRHMQRLEACKAEAAAIEASVDEASRFYETVSRLTTELGLPKAELGLSRGEGVRLQERVSELTAKLGVFRGEEAQLQERVSEIMTELQRAKGAGVSSNVRDAILAEYVNNASFRQRIEFKCSHYSCDDFVVALAQVLILYSGLNLSTLYKPP
ncbi:hypothetical protein ACLOJK_005169 [Asimina triloba]